MVQELFLVDAFTNEAFTGNPAAVTFLNAFPRDERMQRVAREMNHSETAFVVARDDGDYDLRWFTPLTEVDLCGHATLAAAHLLDGTARFHTRSGLLECHAIGDGWIEMDFPADPPVRDESIMVVGLEPVVWSGRGTWDALIELPIAAQVRGLVPDLAALGALQTRGVIVTAEGDRPGIDFVSRVFAPNAGIAEDPVTGSAHCTLASYWSNRFGRTELVGEQASGRGGFVRVRLDDDRVGVAGQAITMGTVTMAV